MDGTTSLCLSLNYAVYLSALRIHAMKPCFLNVDLEITSASNLDAVIAEMGKCVIGCTRDPRRRERSVCL